MKERERERKKGKKKKRNKEKKYRQTTYNATSTGFATKVNFWASRWHLKLRPLEWFAIAHTWRWLATEQKPRAPK